MKEGEQGGWVGRGRNTLVIFWKMADSADVRHQFVTRHSLGNKSRLHTGRVYGYGLDLGIET